MGWRFGSSAMPTEVMGWTGVYAANRKNITHKYNLKMNNNPTFQTRRPLQSGVNDAAGDS